MVLNAAVQMISPSSSEQRDSAAAATRELRAAQVCRCQFRRVVARAERRRAVRVLQQPLSRVAPKTKGYGLAETCRARLDLRQAEELKQNILKFKSDTSMLQERSLWATQQQLQKIYQKVLVLDLDYALDKKVEQDLWNVGFKQQIEALQNISKDRKNPLRSEGQAMLSWVLQAAAGFYLCLLHQICTAFKLDLPFRRRASLLGWVEGWSPGAAAAGARLPPPAAAATSASTVWCTSGTCRGTGSSQGHALVVSTHSGQPYNQLGLLARRRGRRLGALYWHVRAVLVRSPFPPAPNNLLRTLQQHAGHVVRDPPVLPGMRRASPPPAPPAPRLDSHSHVTELMRALYMIHTLENLEFASTLVHSLNSSLTSLVATDCFESMTLIKMVCVIIWLVHSSTEEQTASEGSLSGAEATAAALSQTLAAGALLALLLPAHAAETPPARALPALKVFLQWLVLYPQLLRSAPFVGRPQLWHALAHTLNKLKGDSDDKYDTVPLPEDEELHGFQPLEESFKDLKFLNHATWDTYGRRVPDVDEENEGDEEVAPPSVVSPASLGDEPELAAGVRARRLVALGKQLADLRPQQFGYTTEDGVVTFAALCVGGHELSLALAELQASATPHGRDSEQDSEDDAPLPPPIVISEADFREKAWMKGPSTHVDKGEVNPPSPNDGSVSPVTVIASRLEQWISKFNTFRDQMESDRSEIAEFCKDWNCLKTVMTASDKAVDEISVRVDNPEKQLCDLMAKHNRNLNDVTSMSVRFESIEKRLDNIEIWFDSNIDREDQVRDLQSTVEKLKAVLNYKEQGSLLHDIEISGIQECANENTAHRKARCVREKRVGILKPQGSLERAREERALATTDDQLYDASEDCAVGGDRREIRRPRVNIAMAAILRKQEESCKQVKFRTPPPTLDTSEADTTQRVDSTIDRPKVKQQKSLADIPVGRKTGGILALKDKSGYPHLVNNASEVTIKKPEELPQRDPKVIQPPSHTAKRDGPQAKWHQPYEIRPNHRNYGLNNAGIRYKPNYEAPATATSQNQSIRLPVVNPKEIDVRSAALQRQSGRNDYPQRPNYPVGGDKKSFMDDLPPRFANQRWNQEQDNKFRDDFRTKQLNANMFSTPPPNWLNTMPMQLPQQLPMQSQLMRPQVPPQLSMPPPPLPDSYSPQSWWNRPPYNAPPTRADAITSQTMAAMQQIYNSQLSSNVLMNMTSHGQLPMPSSESGFVRQSPIGQLPPRHISPPNFSPYPVPALPYPNVYDYPQYQSRDYLGETRYPAQPAQEVGLDLTIRKPTPDFVPFHARRMEEGALERAMDEALNASPLNQSPKSDEHEEAESPAEDPGTYSLFSAAPGACDWGPMAQGQQGRGNANV
ncbi:hypothetical protein MSG28_000027 [Choristoneura fumiferana]|uniref:Uncharacterized protein n=1 Tax=Choristoneura fumiferana TaxID=7141 RepID=A0ACC0JZK3_CHOFU|nr:hypothetical protein MSG28_000027 [Choristoneura fumiferana]